MNKGVPSILTRTAVAFLAAASLPALAGVQRTFVAHDGNDANPCSITAPCRAFAAALLQTNPGGEIIVLDSAGYGPVTVDKAVSIIAPAGIYAGVTATSGDGIVVNAPGGSRRAARARDQRDRRQASGSGIVNQAAASLLIDRCTVSGFANVLARVYGPQWHPHRRRPRHDRRHRRQEQPSWRDRESTAADVANFVRVTDRRLARRGQWQRRSASRATPGWRSSGARS